jgi:hypothetical protein
MASAIVPGPSSIFLLTIIQCLPADINALCGAEESMSTKADFSADEWDLLRTSPMMAGLLVVLASPSGPIGLVQESTAMGKMILDAATSAQTPLLKALAEDMKSTMTIPKAPAGATSAGVQDAAIEILRRTSNLLDEKATPEEAAEVKQWLAKVAEATAEAAKEGGFLGFGGTLVSDEEKAAMAKVGSTLGIAAA